MMTMNLLLIFLLVGGELNMKNLIGLYLKSFNMVIGTVSGGSTPAKNIDSILNGARVK